MPLRQEVADFGLVQIVIMWLARDGLFIQLFKCRAVPAFYARREQRGYIPFRTLLFESGSLSQDPGCLSMTLLERRPVLRLDGVSQTVAPYFPCIGSPHVGKNDSRHGGGGTLPGPMLYARDVFLPRRV